MQDEEARCFEMLDLAKCKTVSGDSSKFSNTQLVINLASYVMRVFLKLMGICDD